MDVFGILGERLSHSYSPIIHSYLGSYGYEVFEKSPEELGDFLRHGAFDGLNVTMPYKKTVIPYCTVLSEAARKIGSVNTILRMEDGSLFGDSTDSYGFAYMLDWLGAEVSGKKVLVLGSGGASLAVCETLAGRGAGETVVISRSGEDNYGNIGRHGDALIIVNTTPVGMYPHCGVSPVDLKMFPSCEAVLELIYNPARTTLLLDAEELGIPCVNGLSMLVAQAKRASEHFQGKPLPDSVIDEIVEKISRETQNVVLIGMPGCGKTRVGNSLAQAAGRVFYDTDAIIEERAKRSIPEIIGEEGEEAFRRLETEALREVSAKSGCVIACGGGIVTRKENRRLIRQNGVAVFLDRETSELPTGGRPLSQKTGVEALAAVRLPLYRKWADFTVSACGVEETAFRIKEMLKL